MRFYEAADEFIDSISIRRPRTRETYRMALKSFARFLGKHKTLSISSAMTEFDSDILFEYWHWLERQQPESPHDTTTPKPKKKTGELYRITSIRTYVAGIRRFFRYAYSKRLLQEGFDPLASNDMLKGQIKVPQEPKKQIQRLPALIEYYDALALPEDDGSIWAKRKRLEILRNRALLHTLFGTAARVSEVIAIKRGEIDFDDHSVKIMGKGGKPRYLDLTTTAISSINAYLSARDDEEVWLFISHGPHKAGAISREHVWRIVRHALTHVPDIQTGTNISPHTFRHWRATQMLDDDVPLDVIQSILGHEDIGTTRIYAKTSRGRVKRFHQANSPSPRAVLEKLRQQQTEQEGAANA